MMKLRKFWESNLSLILLLWIIIALIIRPGWIYFLAVFFLWIVLAFLSAPGVFWNYVAIFHPNPASSQRLLERAVSFNPLVFYPYLALGLSYAKRQEWPKAIPMFEIAVEHSPQRKKNQNSLWLAEAYRAGGRNEQALSILEMLLQNGSNSMKINQNLSLVLFQLNRLPEALEYAKKARTFNLSATEPVLIQAKIYFAMGDYQQAKNDYQWVIEHLKYPVESLYWLGRSELELGETDAAVGHLQLAVERITADPLLADVSIDEAEEWLSRALKRKQS